MNSFNTPPAHAAHSTLDSLFDLFKRQQKNPDLDRARVQIYEKLLLLPEINLNEAEDATHKATGHIEPAHFAWYIARQVLASFQYLTHVQNLVSREPEWLRQMIDDWHGYLDKAITPKRDSGQTAPKYILTGFSLVEDHTLTLNQTLLEDLIAELPKPPEFENVEQFLSEADWRAVVTENKNKDKLDEGIWDGVDILALIIVLMNREGLKPAVLSVELQQWIIDYFGTRAAKTLGGAAGNETYILHEIGQELGLSALVHMPYNHQQQAQTVPPGIKRLVFDKTEPTQPFRMLQEDSSLDDPRRFSFVLQLTPTRNEDEGIYQPFLRVGDKIIQPKLSDRVIFRIANPRTDKAIKWRKLRVVWDARGDEPVNPLTVGDPSTLLWNDQTGQWILEIAREAQIDGEAVFKGFLDHDWPYLPLFQHPPTVDTDGTLHIELASAKQLEMVADKVQVVLLGAIQMLGQTVFTPALTKLLRLALTTQLQAFRAKSVSLHLELSSVASKDVLVELAALCREAGIEHISTNREELIQMTSEFGSTVLVSPRPIVPESSFNYYWRAQHLLKTLELCTYYIHDLELDILIRRNFSDEDPTVAEQVLSQHRQAMLFAKAAVPAVLNRRAGATEGQYLTLSPQSLATLLAFANEYALYVEATLKDVEKETVLRQVLTKGYYYHPDLDVSVVVAPTVYVEFDQKVGMAGAGDMCFAVQAAMSRMGL